MLTKWMSMLLSNGIRYLFFAGFAYLLFYVWKKKSFYRFKIQLRFPKKENISTEIKYSFVSIFIFSLMIAGTIALSRFGYTRIYKNFNQHSGWYFAASILIAILVHDTYFYWTHRMMHWKKIFPYVHRIHHLSHNPTPLAAYSFHPIEAIIEAGIIPVIAFVIPVHPVALALFSLYSILMNIMGHLGYELFPKKFASSHWIKWHNSSTHHNMHHHYGKGNYGLYFNVWDRLMKTNHSKYEEEFIQIAERATAGKMPLPDKNQPFTESVQSSLNNGVLNQSLYPVSKEN
jgi:Delta7-sterol 5-desaturase